MKSLLLLSLAAGISLAADAPNPSPGTTSNVPPETVVAIVEGRKLTARELENMLTAMGPQAQQNFNNNRKEFLRQFGLLMKLASLAEQNKLQYESPYRERLEFARMQILMQAEVDKAAGEVGVTAEQQRKYYETNKDRYTFAKIKVIYIPYAPTSSTSSGGKRILNETEARAKAEDLVKQLRSGADFAKLAAEHSEDPTSAQKGGDFGVVRRSDNVPDAIKNTVFALKPGEVSDPVKQPNGFYIFRVEQAGVEPFDQVKNEIFETLREQGFRKWLDEKQDAVQVEFTNEAYFSAQAPAAAQAKP